MRRPSHEFGGITFLTAQAALEAKLDHLALMSRGLAHDLKNLLTPISSFLVYTDSQYAPASEAGEVHAAAKRSVRLMTEGFHLRNGSTHVMRSDLLAVPPDIDPGVE